MMPSRPDRIRSRPKPTRRFDTRQNRQIGSRLAELLLLIPVASEEAALPAYFEKRCINAQELTPMANSTKPLLSWQTFAFLGALLTCSWTGVTAQGVVEPSAGAEPEYANRLRCRIQGQTVTHKDNGDTSPPRPFQSTILVEKSSEKIEFRIGGYAGEAKCTDYECIAEIRPAGEKSLHCTSTAQIAVLDRHSLHMTLKREFRCDKNVDIVHSGEGICEILTAPKF